MHYRGGLSFRARPYHWSAAKKVFVLFDSPAETPLSKFPNWLRGLAAVFMQQVIPGGGVCWAVRRPPRSRRTGGFVSECGGRGKLWCLASPRGGLDHARTWRMPNLQYACNIGRIRRRVSGARDSCGGPGRRRGGVFPRFPSKGAGMPPERCRALWLHAEGGPTFCRSRVHRVCGGRGVPRRLAVPTTAVDGPASPGDYWQDGIIGGLSPPARPPRSRRTGFAKAAGCSPARLGGPRGPRSAGPPSARKPADGRVLM